MRHTSYQRYVQESPDWLNGLPKHWTIRKLGHLARLRSGDNITTEELEDTGPYPVYGGNGVRGYSSRFTHIGDFVLIGRQGALCGNVNYASGKFWASEHAVVVNPLVKFSNHWMAVLLSSMNLNQFSVSAAQPGLAVETIGALRVPVPPIHEQLAIANFLDRKTGEIDALVAKKRALIEKLKEKRSALISRTVTRGLPPEAARAAGLYLNPKLKASGIDWLSKIPSHWTATRVEFVATVKARLGWRGLTADEYVPEGYIFLSTPNIKGEGEIDFQSVNYITQERYLESPEIILEVGDVLVAKDGSTLGITNLVRHLRSPATVNSSIAVIRPRSKSELSSGFLFRWLTSTLIQAFVHRMKDGQGVPHLFQADIKKFPMVLPPTVEQRAIAEFLDRETAKIDALVAKIEQAIERLQEYRTALITAAVTGKIDVRQERTGLAGRGGQSGQDGHTERGGSGLARRGVHA